MTFKNFLKRVNALLHDNRTRLLEGEDIEDWEEVQRQQREKEAERQKKEHAAFIEKINCYKYADVSDESAKSIILELLEFL